MRVRAAASVTASAGITLSYGCNQATQVICEGRLERRGNDFSFMSLQHKMTFHKNKSALHPVSTSDLKNVVIRSTIHIKDTSSLTAAIFLFVVIFLTLCANYTSP